MPMEIRNIIFSANEVLFAFKDFRQRKGDPLPAGSILNYKIIEKPNLQVRIVMACDPDGHKQTITFESEELAAALILFCINRKIPLPADSAKTLQVFEGQLCMVVTINPPKHRINKQNSARLAEEPEEKDVA